MEYSIEHIPEIVFSHRIGVAGLIKECFLTGVSFNAPLIKPFVENILKLAAGQ